MRAVSDKILTDRKMCQGFAKRARGGEAGTFRRRAEGGERTHRGRAGSGARAISADENVMSYQACVTDQRYLLEVCCLLTDI